MVRRRMLAAAAVALTACSGGGDHADAPPADASGTCGAPAGTIASVPGEFTGATVGAGADVAVAEMACADQRMYGGARGEDQVVDVRGLTPDAYYVIELDTDEDLSFYVATGCDADGPLEGACLLHVDMTRGDESAEIVAPASGGFSVIIDSANDPAAPATGAYTLRVRAAECVPDVVACTDPDHMQCDGFRCVECTSAFDCDTSGAPACDDTGTCVAGPAQCTGDDAGEPDDGPAAAQTIAFPSATTAAVCSLGAGEADWYTFTLGAPAAIRFELAWADTAADLDLALGDSTGLELDAGRSLGAGPEAFVAELPAGTYYLAVDQVLPAGAAAATAYTLTLSVPECLTSFDCATAAEPFCGVGLCLAGPDDCTGDDAGDGGTGDDGPAAARVLAGGVGVPVVQTGSVCDVPPDEADWYRFTVAAAEGLTIDLAFAAGEDLDVEAFDAAGNLLGRSWYQNPEAITLTHLPAAPVYVAVTRFSGAFGGDVAAEPYTLTLTRTAADPCTDRADCAAAYSTQIYRGQCNGSGACAFIPDDASRADGQPCDSGGDCTSGLCSYSRFESDADASVCTISCVMGGTDCDVLPGTVCSTGFPSNHCLPACDLPLECGANQGNANLTAGEPWHYYTCTIATGGCSP